jgi:outer membrane murein-binding lipoprotein Lpp
MAVVAMLAPAGCSLGGDEEPKPVSGVAKEIAATVERLERSVAQRDYETVCSELFTARARQRAGGDECVSQMRSAAEDVRRPTIKIDRIEVKADRATVDVATKAEGQARVTDTLELRRTGQRWLIEALG